MRDLILDTNSLIHFKFFTDLPWNDIFEEEVFKIVIVQPVIKELDEHKMSQKGHLQNRSRQILSNIQKIRSGEFNLPSNLTFKLFLESPSEEVLGKFGLNPSIFDDQILASCKLYQQKFTDKKLTLVTADYGLQFKAESLSFDAILLDEEYKISISQTKEEKEIKKLKRKVRHLQNQVPNIEITFPDGNSFHEFIIEEDPTDWEQKIKNELNQIKNDYPTVDESYPSNLSGVASDLARIERIVRNSHIGSREKSTKRYNQELERFYSEYEDYLKKKYKFISQKNRSFPFKLQINNIGTAPAKDVDILFHFPDGFYLFESDDPPNLPPDEKPEPPSRKISLGVNISKPIIPPIDIGRNFRPNIPSNTSLDIKKTNSYDVNFHIQSLKHNQQETTKELVILFESYDDIKSFTVDYKVQAGNIPQELTGELNFIVKLV